MHLVGYQGNYLAVLGEVLGLPNEKDQRFQIVDRVFDGVLKLIAFVVLVFQ